MIVVRGGRQVRLDPSAVVGVGGEATVLALDGATVAKVWHQPTRERADKLRLLLDARASLPAAVAAPTEALFDATGTDVVGCVMPRVPADFAPIATMLRRSPRPRVAEIAATFAELAAIVDGLHAVGVVVGDLNDQNELVHGGAVRLIDADGFQLANSPCVVATEAYADPALYGADLAAAPRFSRETDRYALAVLLFRALLATHPYGGTHPTLTSLPARATARVWVLDAAVRYPAKVALPPAVVSDELRAYFHAVFALGARPPLPVDALARHAAAITTCTDCGVEAPRALPECPVCRVRRPAPTARTSTGTRVDALFEQRGTIVRVDVTSQGVVVFVDDGDARLAFVLGAGAPRRLVLGPRGHDVTTLALDDGSIAYARGEQVVVRTAAGTELVTTTATFDGVPAIARLGGALVRLAGRSILSGTIGRGGLVERTIGAALAGQTYLAPDGATGVLGARRVFSRTVPFCLDEHGLVDLAVRAPSPGESPRGLALLREGPRVLVLRHTERAGIATTRLDLVDARGAVIASSTLPAGAHPTRASIEGRLLRRTTLYHPTDDGVVREELVHGGLGRCDVVPGTESIASAASRLFAHPRGLLVAERGTLFLVQKQT